jgi:hypothetical protein
MATRKPKLPLTLIAKLIEAEGRIDGTTPVAATLLPASPGARIIHLDARRAFHDLRRPTRLAS